MKKKKIYYYPNSSKASGPEKNPYTTNFMTGLENDFIIINKNTPTKHGLFDLLVKLTKIDFIIFNWVEDVPEKKFGFFQAILLILLLFLKTAFKTKIVWVLHNKISHNKNHFRMKKFLVHLLISKADLILTHSKEGIRFVSQFSTKATKKVLFSHHPVHSFTEQKCEKTKSSCDILMWGQMTPYKGVYEFLKNLEKENLLNQYNIIIHGRFSSKALFEQCCQYQNKNIKIINEFIDDEQLSKLMNSSKIILFTYAPDSVLSSGALMQSLNSNAIIIGPDIAAFHDLEKEGCIKVYNNEKSLIQILNEVLKNPSLTHEISINRQRFFEENNWETSLPRLNKKILKLLYP